MVLGDTASICYNLLIIWFFLIITNNIIGAIDRDLTGLWRLLFDRFVLHNTFYEGIIVEFSQQLL